MRKIFKVRVWGFAEAYSLKCKKKKSHHLSLLIMYIDAHAVVQVFCIWKQNLAKCSGTTMDTCSSSLYIYYISAMYSNKDGNYIAS
jgi:hypothetical protein